MKADCMALIFRKRRYALCALAAEDAALRSSDPLVRHTLLNVVRQWHLLGSIAERILVSAARCARGESRSTQWNRGREYLRRAQVAQSEAVKTDDPGAGAALRKIARQWILFAVVIDRISKSVEIPADVMRRELRRRKPRDCVGDRLVPRVVRRLSHIHPRGTKLRCADLLDALSRIR
jgi:hypothetical protein